MDLMTCSHADVREFDGLRTCLACGETRFREASFQDQDVADEQDYIYTDLRCLERGRTIRLIVLAPGDYDDPVHCTLVLSGIHYSEYEAVSYTWATEDGDDSKSHTLYIDGSVLKVTQNCYTAICQLRHPRLSRRLWIDAICINQHNIRERNHQVNVMDHIYQEATNVHVCIRDDSHSYSEAMSRLSTGGRITVLESNQFRELFRRRYFGRVWVMQEIVLAKTIVLHVNTDEIRLSPSLLRSVHQAIDLPHPLRARLIPSAYQDLREELKASLRCACSDPKDHIYAIVSLLDPKIRNMVPVDYNLSLAQVYASILPAYIKTYRTLDVLAYAATLVTDQAVSVTGAFTIDQFQEFLLYGDPLERLRAKRSPPAWRETVQLLSDSDDERLPQESSSEIWIVQSAWDEQQILTGFKVRIHSDEVCDWSKKNSFEELERVCEERISSPPKKIVDVITSTVPTIPQDQQCIRGMVERLCKRKKYGANLFGTGHGMGRSVLPAIPGDRVCYVDGLRAQLLIRGVGDRRYKIVSSCLWEPFEFRYRLPESVELVELY